MKITEVCSDRDPYNFTELIFIIESKSGGTHIESVSFDYEVEGEPHRLEVPWEIVFCGPQQNTIGCATRKGNSE